MGASTRRTRDGSSVCLLGAYAKQIRLLKSEARLEFYRRDYGGETAVSFRKIRGMEMHGRDQSEVANLPMLQLFHETRRSKRQSL